MVIYTLAETRCNETMRHMTTCCDTWVLSFLCVRSQSSCSRSGKFVIDRMTVTTTFVGNNS